MTHLRGDSAFGHKTSESAATAQPPAEAARGAHREAGGVLKRRDCKAPSAAQEGTRLAYREAFYASLLGESVLLQ